MQNLLWRSVDKFKCQSLLPSRPLWTTCNCNFRSLLVEWCSNSFDTSPNLSMCWGHSSKWPYSVWFFFLLFFIAHTVFIENRAKVNKFCFVIIMYGVCDEFMVTLGWSKFYVEFYSKYLYWSVFWTISEFLQNNHCYDYKPEVESPQRTTTWISIVLLTVWKGW